MLDPQLPEPLAARSWLRGRAGEDELRYLSSSGCTVPEAPGWGTRSPGQSWGPRALCPRGPVRGLLARRTLSVSAKAGGTPAGVPRPPGPVGTGE